MYEYDITVYSDPKPLQLLFKGTVPEGQLGRWAILAQEYKLHIKYLPGKYNLIADSLSRIKGMCIEPEQSQEDDSIINFLVNIIENDEWSRHELAKERGKDQHIKIIKSKATKLLRISTQNLI